jgi:RNA polymerase sigma-70 factor (sigma-E family)
VRLNDDMDEPVADFCRRMHPRLVGALCLHIGDAGLAEEIAQEALARTWQRWDRVALADSPDAWVFRVALNLATSRFRRTTTERRALARMEGRAAAPGSDDDTDRLVVRAAVAALPPRQRSALVLRYYADLPVEQTAEAMGCAPGTVKSLTAKAIDNLRANLALDVREVEADA